jgi:hypothetical protein
LIDNKGYHLIENKNMTRQSHTYRIKELIDGSHLDSSDFVEGRNIYHWALRDSPAKTVDQ